MNKAIPFIFPTIALVIVAFLAFRWMRMSSMPQGEIGSGDQISFETLETQERDQILRGAGDYTSVKMQGDSEAIGTIRYEINGSRVIFSVVATLVEPDSGFYQVWVKSGNKQTKAFRLEESKGGYIGSAAVSQSELPADIIISWETQDDVMLEKKILSGVVNK